MFARKREPPPCLRAMFRGLLHGLQMGAMTHPMDRTHTCPPTSAMLGHPSNEHRPRRRPVIASASVIHAPVRSGTASAVPSAFHASMGSCRRRMSPTAGGMTPRVAYSYSPPSLFPAGRTVARRRCARVTVSFRVGNFRNSSLTSDFFHPFAHAPAATATRRARERTY